jgi:hypothetical protein
LLYCWWEYRRTSWQSSFDMVFWEHYHGGAFTSHCLIGLWLEWQYKLYFECQILMLHKDPVCNKPACTHIGKNWKLQHCILMLQKCSQLWKFSVHLLTTYQNVNVNKWNEMKWNFCSLLHVNIL